MFITVFACIGFMLAILYIDLMFDVMTVPHRGSGTTLPEDVIDPIVHYYRRVTQNPYVLLFVMLTTAAALVLQIVYRLTPRWAAYTSLAVLGLAIVAGFVRVIPAARRLASGKEPAMVQTRLAHGLFTAHILLLGCIIALAVIQLIGAHADAFAEPLALSGVGAAPPSAAPLFDARGRRVSTRPFTSAPSIIISRGAVRSPCTDAVACTSSRSAAVTFPITAPQIRIVLAARSALTAAVAPMMRPWSPTSIVPSTLPSIRRSWALVILPSTDTPCPIHALPRRSSDAEDSVAVVPLCSRDKFAVDIQGSFRATPGASRCRAHRQVATAGKGNATAAPIAADAGSRFTIRENGRTIALGTAVAAAP
jgi:hypothetical protein